MGRSGETQKSERQNNEAMTARTLSGLTRSASDVGEPGHSAEKWVTGTRHAWTRTENLTPLERCYARKPRERGGLFGKDVGTLNT